MSEIGKHTYQSKIGKIYLDRRFCFNNFEVEENIVYVLCKSRFGVIKKFIIDIDVLPLINKYIWRIEKRGYVNTIINKKYVPLHRLLLEPKSGLFIDHINRNPLDNRLENLRVCTPQENQRNKLSTGYSFDKSRNKYIVAIRLGKHSKHLGRFDTIEEALKARIDAEHKYFKEFAVIR